MTDTIANCTGCRYFKPIPMARGMGMCRRNPPTPQIVGVDQMGAPQQMSLFPQVSKDVWCGEWQPAVQLQVVGETMSLETKGSA